MGSILFLFFWVGGAAFIGLVFGTSRTIGFFGAFLLSLILSPLLGLIISLFFPTNEEDARQKQILATQQATLKAMQQQQQPKQVAPSLSDELLKLKDLVDKGVITQDEFETQKKKLLEKH
ncbi:SHOCT domain-containing protein [Parasediminibacterium paludis]|uniref:SHOCT domain-containing protein n=1 Tax=Parasediminibacterium paludis TaxID=908966 RepID=A0ABV8PR95_9BACT